MRGNIENIKELVTVLQKIGPLSAEYSDTFSGFTAKGSGSKEAYHLFATLLQKIGGAGVEIDFDGDSISEDVLTRRLGTSSFDDEWTLILDKDAVFNSEAVDQSDSIFYSAFCSENGVLSWLECIDPFSADSDINRHESLVVFVPELKGAFRTRSLSILGFEEIVHNSLSRDSTTLPTCETVRKSIHIQSEAAMIDAGRYWCVEYGRDKECASRLDRLASSVLAAALCSTFHRSESTCSAEISGLKHLSVSFVMNEVSLCDSARVEQLAQLVSWAYDEKIETRLKLIHDRISLDLSPDDEFVSFCLQHAALILKSVKEQYQYVLAEIRNEYEAGKREFLSDLKGIAETYRSKLHSMLTGIIRDFLAVVAILVLSIAPKLVETKALQNGKLLGVLTAVLAGYVLISGLIQFVMQWYERSELARVVALWSRDTHAYLSAREVEAYIKEYTGEPKKVAVIVSYVFLLVYVGMAVSIFKSDQCILSLIPQSEQLALTSVGAKDSVLTDEVVEIVDDQFIDAPLTSTVVCSNLISQSREPECADRVLTNLVSEAASEGRNDE